ncbi:hypothetical protein CEXT_175551 [Caerostris extrusa]|uniref:Uncharacterized protein n=1 Tax=Caerostris extrusa TaxID=172846 RepID=A0AAV4TXL0_CAEEX|nr:hypothetical protein CEXT_175551 [Caerostris extrusa]
MQIDSKHAKRKLHFLPIPHMQMSSLIHFTHLNRTPHFLQFHPPKRFITAKSLSKEYLAAKGKHSSFQPKTVLGTHSEGSSILKEVRLFISNKKGGRNPIKSGLGSQKGGGPEEKATASLHAPLIHLAEAGNLMGLSSVL